DIEEQSAGNVFLQIFGPRILAFAWHVPGGVDDHEVGSAEFTGELVGLDQPGLRLRQSKSPLCSDKHFRSRRLSLVEPSGDRQAFLTQEFGVEQPTLVAGAVIGENRDEGMTGPEVAGKTDGTCDVDAARSAEAKPFLAQQVEDDGQRLRVGYLVGLVDLGAFKIGGNPSLTDPFGDRAPFGL